MLAVDAYGEASAATGLDALTRINLPKQQTVAKLETDGTTRLDQDGVAQVLDIYRREIDRVMGLCGISRIADIGPDLIFRRARRAE